jgi:hypothetical protein
MNTILPALLIALFATQVSAQKEPKEFPWSKAAKIIEADEAKNAASTRKKAETQREGDNKKREKTTDADDKKSKND